MAQRGLGLSLTLTALHLLAWRAYAFVEVNMEDRKEVLLDEAVAIPCEYTLDKPDSSLKIEWFVKSPGGVMQLLHSKNGNEEPQSERTNFNGRINVSYSVDNSSENSILTIDRLMISDEQEYICKVSGDAGSDEKRTRLLVFNTPSFPVIEAEPYATADGKRLEKIATCKVENAYPTPNITWYRKHIPLPPSDHYVHVSTSILMNPSGLQMVKSELYLKLEIEDKNATFHCEVSYFAPGIAKMVESTPVSIELHYPSTEMYMYKVSPKDLVKEGDQVEIRCEGNGNPQPFVTFSLDEEELESKNNSLILHNVTRANSGKYFCFSLEDVIHETRSLNLTVHFLDPVVITPQKTVELMEGKNVSLTCNALSSLPTHTVWYKDNVVWSDKHVLTVNTSGIYKCKIQASSLPELWAEDFLKVIVEGRPVISEVVEVIQLSQEHLVNLSCSATGHPTPTINWILSDDQARVDEWTTETDSDIFSTITIRATSNINATCEAINKMGTEMASRYVKAFDLEKTATKTSTTSEHTEAPTETLKPPIKKEGARKEGSGVIIAVIIIFILLLAILGSVLYFLYKKGKIPCGRSGKQDLTKASASRDDIVVEMKSGKSEEAVLLQGVNGDKKIPNDQ